MHDEWPVPPIWPEHLSLIKELLTPEEYEALLRRLVWLLPDGPLVEPQKVLPEPNVN